MTFLEGFRYYSTVIRLDWSEWKNEHEFKDKALVICKTRKQTLARGRSGCLLVCPLQHSSPDYTSLGFDLSGLKYNVYILMNDWMFFFIWCGKYFFLYP